MCRALVDALSAMGFLPSMCDRRFSSSVDEVGRVTLAKVVAVPSLWTRLIRTLVVRRPAMAVVLLTNRPASFLSDLALVLILRVFRIPVVHYVHTVGFNVLAERGWVWRRAVRGVMSAGAITVCLGPTLRSDVARWVGPDSTRVIPNFAVGRPETVGQTTGHDIVFYSNLIPHKGAVEFVEVAQAVSEQVPEARFVVAGAPGPGEYMDTFTSAVDRSMMDDRLRYIGALSADEKWDFLGTAAVLVFPSRYPFEAQPLAVIEALSVGTRVVAFDVGGLTDLASSRLLTLVPAGDIDAMVRAVVAATVDASGSGDVLDPDDLFGEVRYTTQWDELLTIDMGLR